MAREELLVVKSASERSFGDATAKINFLSAVLNASWRLELTPLQGNLAGLRLHEVGLLLSFSLVQQESNSFPFVE